MVSRAHREEGETLIEVLITIVVLSIGLVAVVGAMGTAIAASAAHRGMADAGVVSREYGELLQAKSRDETAVVPCPDAAYFTIPFSRPGWNQTTVDKVEWWIPDPDSAKFPAGSFTTNREECYYKPGVGDPKPPGYFQTLCPVDTDELPNCDPGLQRVTFTVSNTASGTAGASLTTNVIVRRGNQ